MSGESNTSQPFVKDSPLCPNQDEIDRQGVASPALVKAEIVLGVFLILYAFIGLTWYHQRQKSSIYLRGRDMYLTPISTVGMLVAILSLFVRDIVGRENYPCIFTDLVVPIILFFGAVPLIVRTFIQVNKVKFRLLLAEKTFAEFIHDPTFSSSATLALAQPESERTADRTNFLKKGINRVMHSTASMTRVSSFTSHSKSNQLNGGSLNTSSFDSRSQTSTSSSKTGRKRAILPDHIARMKFYGGRKFGLIMALLPGTLIILIFSIVYGVNDGFSCKGCESVFKSKSRRYVIFGLILVLIFLLLYTLWKLRKEPDPKGMRKEISVALFYTRPLGISWLVLSIVDPGDLEKEGKMQWTILIFLSFFAVFTVIVYLNIRKSYKFSLSSLGANADTDGIDTDLDRVLQSEIGTKLFKSHLVNELSIENYYFWKESTGN